MSMKLVKAATVSLANQVVSSGTNFAIVLYLVRVMDKADFGVYSLGFAMMLLLAGLVSSSISVQYVVNLPDQHQGERACYAVHHANAVSLLGAALVAIAALLMALPDSIAPGFSAVKPVAMTLAIASALYSLRDFLVRVAYSAKREDHVLFSSITIAVAVVGGYAVLYQLSNQDVSAVQALGVLAIAYAAGSAILVLLLKLPLAYSSIQGVKMAFSHSWHGGKWSIITNVVYNIRSQAHNFIVAPLLGMAALADVNAARVLVTPAVMAIPPLSQIVMPRLAEKRARGGAITGKQTGFAILLLAGFATLYMLALLPAMPWVLPIALGEAYQHTGTLVVLWCLVAVIMAARNGLTIILQVEKLFRGLMLVNAIIALVAVALAAFLSWLLGAAGAIMALGLSEFILSFLLFILLINHFRRQSFE